MNDKLRRAPDIAVQMADGAKTRLRDLWRDKKLVLVFLRHFG